MAKKAICGLVLVFMTAAGAFAQSKWYNSYSPSISESKALLNTGAGLGISSFAMGIPPISVSLDFRLKKIPITIGGMGALRTSSYSASGSKTTFTDIGLGVRGMYHFNFAKKLDTYAGLTLGYVIQIADGDASSQHSGGSFFLYGFNLGGRYFLTDSCGAYLEIGYSGLQFISAGLAFRL